jgi:hypothetical protein
VTREWSSAAPSRGRGLVAALWALLGLGLLLLFWQLLGACGVRLPGSGRSLVLFCPAVTRVRAPDAAAAESVRQRVLEEVVRRLELALLQRPACPALPVREAGAEPPAAMAPPAPAVPRVETAAVPTPAEDLPADKWERGEVSLLEGCWELETDYRIRWPGMGRVTNVTNWTMCFDAQGQGNQTLLLSDGRRCGSAISGGFTAQGRLRLQDAGNVPCGPDSFIHERRIDCERVDAARAQCTTSQAASGGHANASFRRRPGGR